MARALLAALRLGDCDVRVASELRTFVRNPTAEALKALSQAAVAERQRLLDAYGPSSDWRPDVWMTYHPYYKSPDLIGPWVSEALAIPYVTVEASYSERRAEGVWGPFHAANLASLDKADVHFVMTDRDRKGLAGRKESGARLVDLPPFLASPMPPDGRPQGPDTAPARLIVVAMMRADVKCRSYCMLARALGRLADLDWTLDIVGDGDARAEVERAFRDALGADSERRLRWHGAVVPEDVPRLLQNADVFVWPGFDEGYGLAYLEAQAAGLPVVAQRSGGVPAVVLDRSTGLLTDEGDEAAFAAAARRLIEDPDLRHRMGVAAQNFVSDKRSLDSATRILMATLEPLVRAGTGA